MADEQYKWLDRETAERLLRGESLEAVDPAAREQTARLAETLGTLSVTPPPTSAELPGEAAALAAFRKVRAEQGDECAAFGRGARRRSADAGLVRIGGHTHAARRPRWARPLRMGLVAALAAAMVGGVAVAAGTGVLPTPFGGEEPAPGASVSAAVTPERPLVSPVPDDAVDGGTGTPAPDGGTSGPTGEASPQNQNASPGGQAPEETPGTTGRQDGFRDWWGGVTAACRDVRDGKQLPADRRRVLEDLAGGSGRVQNYCESVMKSADGGSGESGGSGGSGESKDRSGQDGSEKRDEGDEGDKKDKGSGGDGADDGNGIAPGDDEDDSAPSQPGLTSLLPKRAETTSSPEPAPSPSYSAVGF